MALDALHVGTPSILLDPNVTARTGGSGVRASLHPFLNFSLEIFFTVACSIARVHPFVACRAGPFVAQWTLEQAGMTSDSVHADTVRRAAVFVLLVVQRHEGLKGSLSDIVEALVRSAHQTTGVGKHQALTTIFR